MRVCFSLDNYDRASGGAALAVRGLAHYLDELGHQVSILQPGLDSNYRDGRIEVHTRPLRRPYLYRQNDRDTLGWNRQWQRVVGEYLDSYETDLLFTQNRLLYSSVDAARERGVPSVVWAHAYRLFCSDQFLRHDPLSECSGDCERCIRGVFGYAQRQNRAAYRQGLEQADLVIANSDYMRRVIEHLTGIDAPVVYPTFDMDDWAQPGTEGREKILFIKPLERKGLPIFLDVAREMPAKRFVVAGKTSVTARQALTRLDNVELIEWSDQMKSVYANTRLVLGPSIWPEPFGRVFVEAASAGVPSITSDRGGIPEAVGDAGVLINRIHETGAWLAAIRALDDDNRYEAFSEAARTHALSFAKRTVGAALSEALRETTGLELIPPEVARTNGTKTVHGAARGAD